MAAGKTPPKPAPRTRKNPSQRGDFTGNKKEALQREHEAAVSERRDEIGMVTAQTAAIKDEGVIDLMGSEPRLDTLRGEKATTDPLIAAATGQPSNDDDDEPKLTRAEWEALIADVDSRPIVDTSAREPVIAQPAVEPNTGATRLGDSKTSIDVFELEPERAQASAAVGEALTADLANEPTLIRTLYSLEDVTIGYGNNFTFKEGYKYKVPRWVAAHLEEKGLCDVLSLNVA